VAPGAATAPAACRDGDHPTSDAKYRICMPPLSWNQELVVYAHGYITPNREVEIPEEQMSLPGSPYRVDQIINFMGYAFATTSYRTNGLAVRPAISDLLELVDIFTVQEGVPDRIYLVGVSEGGFITALSLEEYPEVYDGGLAMCGPYGDFRGQVNHFGDFRVVFDYLFPGLMPGEPLSIPTSLMENWPEYYTTTIEPVISDTMNVTKVNQLLGVTDVSPYAFAPPTSTESIHGLLWYNVFATNDGVAKLGGQPFDNQDPYRLYSGSLDDAQLNAGVERISADEDALEAIEAHYQTTGKLNVPLVTLHTTGDPIVPYWHATQYVSKTAAAGRSAFHENIKVSGHGHCAFSYDQVNEAFNTLVQMVADQSRIFLPMVLRGP
jgi:pimeloyl-ACP methyl ester carboxylesterase